MTCLVCLWRLLQFVFFAAGLWSLYMLFCYTELACAMIGCSP